MDNPPQARPTATAAPCPVERTAEPTPGIAGVPPAPAGGRQWTTRRRPGQQRQPRHARSNASRSPPSGRPGQPAAGPANSDSRAMRSTHRGIPLDRGRPPAPAGGRRWTTRRRPGQQRQPRHARSNASRSPPLGSRASRPPRLEAGNGQPAAGPGNSDSRAMSGRTHRGAHPWDRGRPARPGRRPAMDNPPQARPTATAAPCPVERTAEPTPGIAGVPPAPAGGRQWTTRRRPGQQRQPPPCPVERIAEPTPGIAGVPPAPAGGPPVCPGG